MNLWLPVLCVFLATTFSEACELMPSPLKIMAFNVKSFGDAKMSNPFVANILATIVKRNDIILIQEVRDTDLTAMNDLHDLVNRSVYNVTYGEQQGRTPYYNEKYMFFTKLTTVEVLRTHQYYGGPRDPDNHTDHFERPPFCVEFQHKEGSFKFAIIPIHTRPDEAVKEIGNLDKVVENLTHVWPDVENYVIMGDFNAGCTFATETKLQNAGAEIYINPVYFWAINGTADTTTKTTTDCPYDRIVLRGDDIRTSYVPCSAWVFNYEEEYNITNAEALDVSDHFAVDMVLS